MAHLGADVAAFVDGQMSDVAMAEASEHLESCEQCRQAVRQQRLLKSRMSTVATPEPPAQLLASLAGLAAAPPPLRESWWGRMRRSVPFRAGLVLAGASVAVVVAAYVVGGAEETIGDEVAPPYDRYAADFFGPTTVQAAHVISESTMNELDGSGWPCLATLAGDLHRTSGAYTDHGEVVALKYTDGVVRLDLFEQNGALDRDSLDGFEPATVGESQVWMRQGVPMLVTWDDDDGVVYTIVTDADRDRVERAVAELPSGHTYDDGVVDRVGDGLSRMTGWLNAA